MISSLKPEEALVVNKVLELPPESLLDVLWTDDQRKSFQSIKFGMRLLGQRLDDFFSGQDSSIRTYLINQEINSHTVESIESFFDFFISFYTLIQPRWGAISEKLQQYGIQDVPCTPGEALVRAIKDHCDCIFDISISPYREIKVKSQYLIRQKLKKLDLAKQENQISVARKYQKEINDMWEPVRKYHLFRKSCVFAADEISQGDRTYRLKLKRFKEDEQAFVQNIRATMHPRKGKRGWVWKDGVKTQLNQHGHLPKTAT